MKTIKTTELKQKHKVLIYTLATVNRESWPYAHTWLHSGNYRKKEYWFSTKEMIQIMRDKWKWRDVCYRFPQSINEIMIGKCSTLHEHIWIVPSGYLFVLRRQKNKNKARHKKHTYKGCGCYYCEQHGKSTGGAGRPSLKLRNAHPQEANEDMV